jgi:ABC-type glycerol-3-phosphate transport system substrate-binding protein
MVSDFYLKYGFGMHLVLKKFIHAAILLFFLPTLALALPAREMPAFRSSNELLLWHSLSKPQAAVLRSSLDAFTEKTGVAVRLETGMDFVKALLKQKRFGALPDAVLTASDLIASASDLDMSSIPKGIVPDSVQNRFVTEFTLDGRLLGVPVLSGNHLVLYSNASIVPVPASTWEEIALQRVDLEKRGISAVGIPVGEPYSFLPFLIHAGALDDGLLSPDLGAKWSRLGVAMDSYGKLISSNIIPARCSFTCAGQEFFEGRFAYAISGDWLFAEALAILGKNLRVSPLPTLAGKPLPSISSSQGLFFPGNSLAGSRREALRKLVRHLLDETVQFRLAREMGRIPVVASALKRLSHSDITEQQKNLIRIFDDSITLRSTRETVLTWLLLQKALAFQTQKAAPTETIVQFLERRTARQLQRYRGVRVP